MRGNLGTISAFACRHRETKKNLCREKPVYVLVNSCPPPTVFRSTHRGTPNCFLRWAQKCLKTALRVANALLSQVANLYRTWFQIYVQNYILVGSGKRVNSHTMS
jgi:hypothetical protein